MDQIERAAREVDHVAPPPVVVVVGLGAEESGLRVACGGPDELVEQGRVDHRVVVQEEAELGRTGREREARSLVVRLGKTEVPVVLDHDHRAVRDGRAVGRPRPGIPGREPLEPDRLRTGVERDERRLDRERAGAVGLDPLDRAVGRAVVDADHEPGTVSAPEQGLEALDRVPPPVPVHEDDPDHGVIRRCLSGHLLTVSRRWFMYLSGDAHAGCDRLRIAPPRKYEAGRRGHGRRVRRGPGPAWRAEEARPAGVRRGRAGVGDLPLAPPSGPRHVRSISALCGWRSGVPLLDRGHPVPRRPLAPASHGQR